MRRGFETCRKCHVTVGRRGPEAWQGCRRQESSQLLSKLANRAIVTQVGFLLAAARPRPFARGEAHVAYSPDSDSSVEGRR
jgi:hypothetical protein